MFSAEIFIFVGNRFIFSTMFVDIHTHKSLKSDFPAIRNLTFDEADTLFPSEDNGLFSVGIHPWDADLFSIAMFSKLKHWTMNRRLVAIGECGLDKHCNIPLDVQQYAFEQQIALSEQTEKPLIIHCVGCFNELFEIKKKINPRQLWIIHGFRAKPQLAIQALKAGCTLSFGEHFNEESVRVTPLDKLYVETDKSQTSISEIYRHIAQVKNTQPDFLIAGEHFFNTVASL